MSKVLIIGAGGVARVSAHKCAQNPEVFGEIQLASRTLGRCEAIQKDLVERYGRRIEIAQLDADDSAQTVKLIEKSKPDLVMNLALPYQDLAIMDACLETGVDYLDTANYEPPDEAKFEYKWQWAYQDRFQKKGLLALLGSGFDPGVTNVFTAWALKHHFDEIHLLDILDANAGDHGLPFATNFNPEINIREITQEGRFWENGDWRKTAPLEVNHPFDFPEIGTKQIYLMYHEEMESLARHVPGLKRMRFWMTFSEKYLTHLRVLQNVGLTSIEPVDFEGKQIVPLQFLKRVLPDPSSLGPLTKGKTNIGCLMTGLKNGKKKQVYVYNVCDHQEAFAETGAQAISYTTGVPAAIGAMMILQKKWQGSGVFNMEQMDPDPFMEELNRQGLPWVEKVEPGIEHP